MRRQPTGRVGRLIARIQTTGPNKTAERRLPREHWKRASVSTDRLLHRSSRKTARPPQRLFHLVFESHDGRALVPIPKRSTSPRAASTLNWWDSLKALDPERPIREGSYILRSLRAMGGTFMLVSRHTRLG